MAEDSPKRRSERDEQAQGASRQHHEELRDAVGDRAERRRLAQAEKLRTVWFGLGTFGLVGWSVAIPVVVGTLVGVWLDRHYPMRGSWALTLLVAGALFGCWNAWQWIEKESRHERGQ